jgi:anaerobic magnesium-protoporphyrin IX monomethyl ester cyclase
MKKVLITHSYFLAFDPKQKRLQQPYAPLGMLYAAAVLRAQGYEVVAKDVMFAEGPEVMAASLQSKPDYFVIYDDGFNYLTKMCLSNMRDAAYRMIELARESGTRILISSSDSTDHYADYIGAGADVVLLGEAEQTLMQVLSTWDAGLHDLSNVPGLAFKQEGVVKRTGPRPVMKDLDALPFPAWDLIDLEPYRNAWKHSSGYFSLNMGTTRGCPFKCNWCAKPIYGNRYNARNPRNVVDELLMLKEQYRFDHIWFCDDIFGLKPGWVQEFARLVQQEGLQFRFKIQSRADLLVQENYVAALAAAGCENVWMGAESGSQKILDAMDKGITTSQIEQATALLKSYRVNASFFIQFGYLGEDESDIRSTVKMINKLLPHEIGISVSYPLPGTVFYEKVKLDLKQKTNWTDSDEMALMFRNTYSPQFYKQLHGFVHKSYRKHLSFHYLARLLKGRSSWNYKSIKKAFSFLYYTPAAFISGIRVKQLQKT